MKPTSSLTQTTLHQWLTYDGDAGNFFWRQPPSRNIKVGDEAGSAVKTRYGQRRMLWVRGQRIYAARAAYIYVHGDIEPTVLVDHIDGDPLNDRIANLRLAGTTQNVWNRVQRSGSRYKLGVSKGDRGRFKARIQLPSGKKMNLGTWGTEEEAHAAYMGAAALLHSDFLIGNRMAEILDFTTIRERKAG